MIQTIREKIYATAEEMKKDLQNDIYSLDGQIKDAKGTAKAKVTLAEKLEAQKEVQALVRKRDSKLRNLFDAEDQINMLRDQLLDKIVE